MLVGIICEGPRDTAPLKEIILGIAANVSRERILTRQIEFKTPFVARGPIYSKLEPAVKTLMTGDAPDLIVFYSDIDRFPSRRIEIPQWIEDNRILTAGVETVSFLVEPHFEDLFIREKNAVVNYFKLPGEEPLPYEGMEPKARIERIIVDARTKGIVDFTLLNDDVYADLARMFNIQNLTRQSDDFNHFQQELRGLCTKFLV